MAHDHFPKFIHVLIQDAASAQLRIESYIQAAARASFLFAPEKCVARR